MAKGEVTVHVLDLPRVRERVNNAELMARRGLEAAGHWRTIADHLARALNANGPWQRGISPGQTTALDALDAYNAAVVAEQRAAAHKHSVDGPDG